MLEPMSSEEVVRRGPRRDDDLPLRPLDAAACEDRLRGIRCRYVGRPGRERSIAGRTSIDHANTLRRQGPDAATHSFVVAHVTRDLAIRIEASRRRRPDARHVRGRRSAEHDLNGRRAMTRHPGCRSRSPAAWLLRPPRKPSRRRAPNSSSRNVKRRKRCSGRSVSHPWSSRSTGSWSAASGTGSIPARAPTGLRSCWAGCGQVRASASASATVGGICGETV